jgi:sensor c-di-GMP phosphodiesterase-like protein
MHTEIQRDELAKAIKERKLSIVYQPLVDIHASNKIIGFEALVRLTSEAGKKISADNIVNLCEKYHLISDLSQCVIELSLQDFVQLLVKFPDAYLAINLSTYDIDEAMIAYLWKKMHSAKIHYSQIMIELTERVAMNPVAHEHLKTLRSAGHSLSIDDFGSGASSVRYLADLTPEIVKIDKAFVDWSTEEGPLSTLLMQLITLAKTLHAEVVVEGVETKSQAEKVLACGAHYGQGYYWYAPLSLTEIMKL